MRADPTITYSWAVIGAGPAGITTVGILLDHGIDANDILWLDPHFQVGDLGQHWGVVTSNTTVGMFLDYFNGIQAFQFAQRKQPYPIESLNKAKTCLLAHVTEPLAWISQQLQDKVHSQQATIQHMTTQDDVWTLQTENINFKANKVVLAIGATPKSLDYPAPPAISLREALNPEHLKTQVNHDDVVAVFGSSHSAMIIIRSLIEVAKVKKVINFYRHPIRYAINMGDWILYDNTGLKGETADWTHQHISQSCHPKISRHQSNASNIKKYLPQANKAIYAVGFTRRQIPINGTIIADYDPHTGIIAPGLFGVGIAYPKLVSNKLNIQEYNVGLWKFMNDIDSLLPIWLQYKL